MFLSLISSWGWIFLVLAACVLAYVIYNLYLHPLATIPGPLLARASLLWRLRHSMTGHFHRAIEKQHQIYGNVVRVSPNEVSFASTQSWKDIYGTLAGKPTFIKSEFYEVFGAGFDSNCIGSERDPQVHGRMKRSLLGAFSIKSLKEQEEIIQNCIDRFLIAIGIEGKNERGIDLTKWFEMIAFDILGEMAFGESFGCIEQGAPHSWQQMVAKHLFFVTVVDNLRRYPLVRKIGQWLLPKLTVDVRNKHTGFSREKIARRLASKSNRKDFLTTLVKKVEEGEVSEEELTAHASTLVLAGGETVSTFLAASTYYLCKYPEALRHLQYEIRSRFKNYEEIDATSAMQLPYLQAVIQEGLRIYPPGSQGFPRISPGAYVDGIWIPAGTEVYSSAWTITHSASNFHRPNDFLPSRWLDEKRGDLKEASQPFSLGTRGCIGRNFANLEMSLILAKMYFLYDLHLVDSALDWEGQSHIHVQWWKPALRVRIERVSK